MYDYFQDVVKGYLTEVAAPQMIKNTATAGVLVAYLKEWNSYAFLIGLLQRMFSSLNTVYLKNSGRGSLGTTALDLFNQVFYNQFRDIFREGVFIHFTKDRNGEIIDKDELRKYVKCFAMQGLK
jgi:hypothetical protein